MISFANYGKYRKPSYDDMSKDEKLSGLDQSLGYLISSQPDSIPSEEDYNPQYEEESKPFGRYEPERMNEDRFTPSNFAAKEYETYAKATPKREDYKPSTGRNIMAGALAGLSSSRGDYEGAIKLGSQVRDQKYNEARRDYDERGEGLYKVAKLEDDANQRGMRNQNYTDMYRDRAEDNNRDAYYKGLANDVANERLKNDRTRNEGIASDRERNFGLRERNTNSSIGARDAGVAQGAERVKLLREKAAKGSAPKVPTANQNLAAQTAAEKLVDQNLASLPEFAHIYTNGKINGEAATNTFHALRRHYIEELLKKHGKGNGRTSPEMETEPDEPDNDEDDPSGFNFQ